MTISLPASYTDIPSLFATVPRVGSYTAITSDHYLLEIGKAQALIDGKLARRYSVPFSPVPDLIESVCTDITLYGLLTKRVFASDAVFDEAMVKGLARAFDILDDIAEGDITLTTSGTIVSEASIAGPWSNHSDYLPTAHEGPWERMPQDETKIDEALDARD